jgi:hypothetical protein
MSTRRFGILDPRSDTAWMVAPGTHFFASRHQFVTTDAGHTMMVGVSFFRPRATQESATTVFPVPWAFATSTL